MIGLVDPAIFLDCRARYRCSSYEEARAEAPQAERAEVYRMLGGLERVMGYPLLPLDAHRYAMFQNAPRPQRWYTHDVLPRDPYPVGAKGVGDDPWSGNLFGAAQRWHAASFVNSYGKGWI